jgi:glycosyltransferase involved in cell wall biosynthesis
MSKSRPLVSVLIPSYSERYFGEAFASALAQTYSPLEIVVSDDSPGTVVGETVARAADSRVRYFRNSPGLGFAANFSQCYRLAQGEFIKFLNDDDRLRPSCVEALAGALMANPRVTLAFSRRAVIDEHGSSVGGDIPATTPLAMLNALFPGIELGNLVLANFTNFIGEPSTALFRRASVEMQDGFLFRWGGHDFHCFADVSLWLRLLQRGPAYYVSWTLSEFRLHSGQEQRKPDVAISCLLERLPLVREARKAGFLAPSILHRASLEIARNGILHWMKTQPLAPSHRLRLQQALPEFEKELAAVPA